MKLAVFFPGIGYHCDKPLLYYSGKLAAQYQYEVFRISYTDLSSQLHEAFEQAFAQTEKCLEEVRWSQYDEVLFVSKSIGTAISCAYARKHGIRCRNVYYTPLAQTFDFGPQPGIVFHGTKDPWADTDEIREKCKESNLPLQIVEEANHSLEVKDNTWQNVSILMTVMEQTEGYIADLVQYRRLHAEEIECGLFNKFIRHQNVTKCRRRENGEWVIREEPFVDDWTKEDYQTLVACLKNTDNTDGFVYGAFYRNNLKGFVSVESGLFGGEHKYLDLSSIHVSEDMRGRGIGKALFRAAEAWAREKGAGKLYISAHSAVETQSFYQAMGCVEAQMYHQGHVDREPYDCQLERKL